MVNIAVTRMSSKGQVVIPIEMRKGIKEGEKLLIIKDSGRMLLKKASDTGASVREDLIFAKRTEEAFKRYRKGMFKEMDGDEFLKQLAKW